MRQSMDCLLLFRQVVALAKILMPAVLPCLLARGDINVFVGYAQETTLVASLLWHRACRQAGTLSNYTSHLPIQCIHCDCCWFTSQVPWTL